MHPSTPGISGNERKKRGTFSRTLNSKHKWYYFFDLQKFNILFIDLAQFFTKKVLSWRIRHLRKIILEGRGFWGDWDEKMRRMWLGLEIVVAGRPPFAMILVYNTEYCKAIYFLSFFRTSCFLYIIGTWYPINNQQNMEKRNIWKTCNSFAYKCAK